MRRAIPAPKIRANSPWGEGEAEVLLLAWLRGGAASQSPPGSRCLSGAGKDQQMFALLLPGWAGSKGGGTDGSRRRCRGRAVRSQRDQGTDLNAGSLGTWTAHIGASWPVAPPGRIPTCVREKGPVCMEACLAVVRYVQGGERDFIPLTDAGTGWGTTRGWGHPAVPERSKQ